MRDRRIASALAPCLPLALLLVAAPSAAAPRAGAARPAAAQGFEGARHVDAGLLNMTVSNQGSWAYDLARGYVPGLYYPKGLDRTVVFASGLWLGAQVGGTPRVTVAEYSFEYAPGAMLPDGSGDDPARPEYRVYKVARWRGDPQDSSHVEHSLLELAADPTLDPIVHHSWSEYLNGAAPHGAPVRLYRLPLTTTPDPADSVDVPGPDVRGDQMLWCVYNDADPSRHTNAAGHSAPLGVEVRQTVWSYDRPGPVGQAVFLHFDILARGATPLDAMYVGLWSDADVGGMSDDLAGSDPTRGLGYAYNGTNSDAVYGSSPPAVGYDLLRGPRGDGGIALPAQAFTRYINGTDPQSSVESYNALQGLQGDGSPMIDPTNGQPTRFFAPGDPVGGAGWLDALPADRRMMLSAGPFHMAPGDTQHVDAAIIVGQALDRLGSVAQLRFADDAVQTFFDTGTPPDTTPPLPVVACPRRSAFWAAECPGGGGALTPGQLDSIAVAVNARSRFFSWAPGQERQGLCGVLAPPVPLDVRQQAIREYAALLANMTSGLLGTHESNGYPILFNPGAPFTCSGLKEQSIDELLAVPTVTAPGLYAGGYEDLVPTHPVALAGVDVLGPIFGGGGLTAWDFFGSALDPSSMPDSFATVELRFDGSATQKAYRYLRDELPDGTSPAVGRGYSYAGFTTVPFQVWDADHGIQLDVAFVERQVTDDNGAPYPAAAQPATLDSTWGPDASADGAREYLSILRRPYQGTPRAELTVDGGFVDGSLPWLYSLWSRRVADGAVIDDGDRFRFVWGAPPDTSFEARLLALEGQPLSDPVVTSTYTALASCFASLNAGDGVQGRICDAPTPVEVSLISAQGTPDGVALAWYAGAAALTVVLERSEGGAWSARAVLSPDGSGRLAWTDRDVVPGHRYGYRLRAATPAGAVTLGEVWVGVPAALELGLAGLTPNPATRDVTLAFVLPRRAPATLTMLDVSGRRVLEREVGGLGPGRHVLDLDPARRLAAGVYFLELVQGGRRVTTRGVIVR